MLLTLNKKNLMSMALLFTSGTPFSTNGQVFGSDTQT